MSSYRVPSKDYGAQYAELLPNLLPRIEEVLRSENPILGAPVREFEEAFARRVGTQQAVGVGSGTDALVLALRALGVGPGDEVVTAANTFIATVTAVMSVGARPVLVDPDPETMNVTAGGVLDAVTDRTRAVVPVHLYGRMAPVRELRDALDERGIFLIEDAAQAHGARDVEGNAAGSVGHAGCFSFHPSKNLGAFGDGGLITTSDPALADRLRVMRNLGKVSKHEVDCVGANSKLDTIQAVILLAKLDGLERGNARRRHLAALYAERLAGVGDLVLPDPAEGALSNGPGRRDAVHLYVVRTDRRDLLCEHLEAAGVRAAVHYPVPPHLQPVCAELGYSRGALPAAEACAARVLSLPIAPELTDEQVIYAADCTRAFFTGERAR